MIFKAARAERLHDEAMHFEAKGRWEDAEATYRKALELVPDRGPTLFNLGLICKYQGRWRESFEFSRRACEADAADEGAAWNLGIAATALRDWKAARTAWHRCGLPVPEGSGPIVMTLGPVPVRLNPADDGEVVWTDRIDPARAVIRSIPFPTSGFACGDTVLHDGAPVGYRKLGNAEIPVFDVLCTVEPSCLSTYVAEISAPAESDVDALAELCCTGKVEFEHWTSSVRWLCKACSEGRPHEGHDQALAVRHWQPRRQVAFAAAEADLVEATLQAWAGRPGCAVVRLTCELDRKKR